MENLLTVWSEFKNNTKEEVSQQPAHQNKLYCNAATIKLGKFAFYCMYKDEEKMMRLSTKGQKPFCVWTQST